MSGIFGHFDDRFVDAASLGLGVGLGATATTDGPMSWKNTIPNTRVMAMQAQINAVITKLPRPFLPIDVDGKLGPQTCGGVQFLLTQPVHESWGGAWPNESYMMEAQNQCQSWTSLTFAGQKPDTTLTTLTVPVPVVPEVVPPPPPVAPAPMPLPPPVLPPIIVPPPAPATSKAGMWWGLGLLAAAAVYFAWKKKQPKKMAANRRRMRANARSLGGIWKGVPWDKIPSDIRLQVGTLKEREEEARRQGVFETWETKARRASAPPQLVALGRIGDMILSRDDADRIALRPMQGSFADYEVKRFSSRSKMVEFLKKDAHREGRDMSGRHRAEWKAAIKDRVQHVAYRSFETKA